MLSTPQPENPTNGSDPIPSAPAVRDQLRRLLAHPLFKHSKRYPALLSHTVEQTLLGNTVSLKERSIGVDAFGRAPNYDVGLDPVVRMAAAEVRKRLSQYYYDAEHAGELVIELPVGSYIPSFREPLPVAAPAMAAPASPEPEIGLAVPASEPPRAPSASKLRQRLAFAAAFLLVGLIGYGAGHLKFPNPPSNMDRFWEPITLTSSRVTYCLGEPTLAAEVQRLAAINPRFAGSLNVSDVITLARSLAPLVPKNGVYRVTAASETGFSQLREGPFVLIGAFDNPWTLRITQDLPFGFEYDGQLRKVVDRKSGGKRFWTLRWQVPETKLAEDYAIVARIHDKITGQPVIVIAGILGEGTEAASEVVSNPTYLNALLQKAPKNWNQLNLQAVVHTDVIDGHPGPPSVVAVESW